jgi:serine protease Do
MFKRYIMAHSHSHIVIILLSFLLGAVATGLVLYYPHAQQAMATVASAQGLDAFDDMFVRVAAKTTPTVVTITADQVVQGGGSSGFDLRDFFKNMPPGFENPFGGGDDESGSDTPRKPGTQPRAQRRPVLGSGWIYSSDGYIVTNAHVVADTKNIKVKLHDVQNDLKEYPAKIVGTDPKTELAVIKIDAPRKLPTLQLGNSENLRIGQWVMAVGAPFRYEQTVTAGIVSAKGRKLEGESKYVQLGDIIQTDASINPGNSGGPLVDLHGSVVGINVAIAAAGPNPANVGIGFAVPADTAKVIIPQLISKKKVVRGWLGINIKELNENLRDAFGVSGGVLVDGIRKDGPAAKSDLKIQDVIVAVNGTPVNDTYELQKAIGNSAPGTQVAMDVYRDGKSVKVTVTLGEMPANVAGFGEEKSSPEEAATPETGPEATALGIKVSGITEAVATKMKLDGTQGVLVTDVAADSPAANRLTAGMVVLQVGRDQVNSPAEFKAAMGKAAGAGKSYILLRVKASQEGEFVTTTMDIPLDQG